MIINPSKINFGGGGSCTGSSAVISTKDFSITANGETSITMEEGVDGISAGTITTNVQPTLTAATYDQNGTYNPGTGIDGFSAVTVNVDLVAPYNSGYTAGYSSGYTSGQTDGIAEQKALLTSTAITSNGTVTNENGWSGVTVNVQPVLTAATFDQNGTYTPGSGVAGFNSVTVNVDGAENRLNTYLKGQVTAITQSDLAGVTNIPAYQFYGKSSIKAVDLPSSVQQLSNNSFNSSGIQSIDISNVNVIEESAFQNCTSLTGITGFENYTRQATNNMFNGCTALAGGLVTGILPYQYASSVFNNCRSLTSITFLSNMSEVGGSSNYNQWFNGCTSMQYLDYTHNYTVPTLRVANPFTAFTQNYEIRVPQILYDQWTAATYWSGSSIVNHIVAYPNAYDVMSLKYTTSDGNDITPLNPYTSITLWNAAFVGSEFDATTGGTVSFYGPQPTIPSYTWCGVTTLESMEIASAVTAIDYSTFQGCTGLTGVTIPGVTRIKQAAFKGCTSLPIDNFDFTKYTEIGNSAFTDCVGLAGSITLPSSCTVGTYAFYGCTGITSVTLPSTGSVSSYSFQNCGLVGTLTVPNCNVLSGSQSFKNCTGLTDVVFEGDYSAYSAGAGDIFKDNANITGATFNSGVTFQFGSGINYSRVVSMTFKSSTPPTGALNGSFNAHGTMYVPAESLEAYNHWAFYNTFSGWTITSIVE